MGCVIYLEPWGKTKGWHRESTQGRRWGTKDSIRGFKRLQGRLKRIPMPGFRMR